MSEKTSTKEITKCRGKIFWRVTAKNFFFLLVKRSRGHILKRAVGGGLEHPEKVVFLTERGRKRVKEWR